MMKAMYAFLDAFERTGSAELAFSPSEGPEAASKTLDSLARAIEQSPDNRLVIDL